MLTKIVERKNLVKPPALVMVRMSFGRPGKRCENFGICHMEMISSPKLTSRKKECCASCNVIATLTYFSNTQFQLTVIKTLENKAYLKKYFDANYFLVEEDYELPMEIVIGIGADKRKISKGIYQIIKKESFYTVLLCLE